MKKAGKILLSILFLSAFIVSSDKKLHADIVILIDGTVIVGKVIEENENTVNLKNSYKLFVIERKKIKNTN